MSVVEPRRLSSRNHGETQTMLKLLACVVLLAFPLVCLAGDWPQWRGPYQNGSSDEKNLPQTWSATENVAWVAKLPGPSASTPAVWGDRVFVSSSSVEGKDLLSLCLSVKDGKVLWQQTVAKADTVPPGNTHTSPSPVTDGRRVYFLYGTGDLAAFTVEGKPLWTRHLGEDYGRFSVKFGYSSSPLLFQGKLYVQVLRCDRPYSWSGEGSWPTDSFLLAVEAATGKDLWKRPRKTEAVDENQDAYNTPVVFKNGKRTEIAVIGGDCVTGHDPATGEELWRMSYNPDKRLAWRLVPSLVPGEGVLYGVTPRGGNPLFAIPGGRSGPITWQEATWTYKTFTPDVCTPLLHHGRLYVLCDIKGVLSCLDPKTGREFWRVDLEPGAIYRASPTGADGRIYCVSERGVVTVLAAGDTANVLSRIAIGEGPIQSSIVAARGRLFLRTAVNLYCLRQSPAGRGQ